MRAILLALIFAGCTSYVPFKDGPAPPQPSPLSESEQKHLACEKRGGQMTLLPEGPNTARWHCLAK